MDAGSQGTQLCRHDSPVAAGVVGPLPPLTALPTDYSYPFPHRLALSCSLQNPLRICSLCAVSRLHYGVSEYESPAAEFKWESGVGDSSAGVLRMSEKPDS